MPNLPISGLPAASTLDGSELFAAVQSGVTTYTTLEDVSNYVTSSISTIDTGSLMVTGSISGQTLTFEKGDGSTFNIFLTPGGAFPITYGLFNQTGSSIPVSGSDPSGSLIDGGVGTLSVPANGFARGDAFRAVMSGKLNAAGGGVDLEIVIESDGTILADTGVITMPTVTDKNWQLDINFSINEVGEAGTAEIASAGSFTFRTDSAGDVVSEIFSAINNTTFDTTINNTLRITAIWSGNADADDTIYSQLFTLRKIY